MMEVTRLRHLLPILGLLTLLIILSYSVHQAWVGKVNPTFVTALATTALVLVTLYYAYQSRRYARYSRDTLKEMRKSREKRSVLFVIRKGIDPIWSTFAGHKRDFPEQVEESYQPHRFSKSFFTPEDNLLLDLEDQHPGIIEEIHEYADLLRYYSDLQEEVWEELILQLACDIEELDEESIERQVLDVDLGPIYGDGVDLARTQKKGEVLPKLADAIIGIPDLDDIEVDGVEQIWQTRRDHYLNYREKEGLADYFEGLALLLSEIRDLNEHLIEVIVGIREQYKQEYGLTEAEISEIEGSTRAGKGVIAEVI